jgi:hypothetical protein
MRSLLGAILVLGVLLALDSPAQEPSEHRRREAIRVTRLTSRSLPIEVSSPDLTQNRALLETAERVWRLGALMLLPLEDGKASLRIRWVQVPAGTPPPPVEYPGQLQLAGSEKIWVIDVWGEIAPADRALARAVASAYAQAVAWDGAMPRVGQELARPPFWLAEGMAARLSESRKEEWAEVIARCHRTQTLPSLKEIQDWDSPGPTRLDAHLRQAVCYWLGRIVARTPAESRTLRLWLQEVRTDPQARYWDKPEAESWWRQSALERLPSELPLLSWEQTAARIREAIHFPARLKGERESRVLSLMDLPDSPAALEDPQALREVSGALTRVRAQSHWLWVYIIEKYEAALGAWVLGNYPEYRLRLDEAIKLQERMNEVVQGSSDLLDWVTVNFPASTTDPNWVNFRTLVDGIERARPGRGSLPRQSGIE